MIRKLETMDKKKVLDYLGANPAQSVRICAAMETFGFDSEEANFWGDFWVDGEIKCIFAIVKSILYIYSNAAQVETTDIYVFLRDNKLPYTKVIGDYEKIKEYQRHVFFKEQYEYLLYVLNARWYQFPQYEKQAECAGTDDLEAAMQFLALTPLYKQSELNETIVAQMLEKNGIYAVKENGDIAAMAVCIARAGKIANVAKTMAAKGYEDADYQKAALNALCEAYIQNKFACCVELQESDDKSIYREIGFRPIGTMLVLVR